MKQINILERYHKGNLHLFFKKKEIENFKRPTLDNRRTLFDQRFPARTQGISVGGHLSLLIS